MQQIQLRVLAGAQIASCLDPVAQLRIAVFREFPYLYEGDAEYERRYLAAYVRSPDSVCVLACDGEAVIGYAVLMVALDEAHLLNIAIAGEWQNQGLGRAFLRHMVEEARSAGAQIVYLEVRPSNLAARHLYRSLGFQQIAIRPDYYPAVGGREDALFLGLTL